MKTAVIYKIVNTVNNNCYIGSSTNYSRRIKRHFEQLKSNNHHSIALQRAFVKYGADNFEVKILLKFPYFNREDVLDKEQYYIDRNNSVYNICKIAGSQLGSKRTDEFKRKCSKRMTGKPAWNKGLSLPKHSKERSNKISKALRGRVVTQETRRKISIANKGKLLTEEHKAKLSKAKIKNPVNNIIVEQYLDDVLINTFISIGEACRSTGLSYQTIRDSINKTNRKWKSKKNKWTWRVQIN